MCYADQDELYTDGEVEVCEVCGSWLMDGELVVLGDDIPEDGCDLCGATE
jgi:hypothetical protein